MKTVVSTPAFVLKAAGGLVTPVAVFVTVRKSLAEVALEEFPVAKTRTVVFRGPLEIAFVTIVEAVPAAPVLATLLDAVIVAGVQRGLAKLKGTTVAAVTIPVATASISVVLSAATVIVVATTLAVVLIQATIAGIVPIYENISGLAAPSAIVLRGSRQRQRQKSHQSQHANSREEFLSLVIHHVLPSISNSPIAQLVSGRAICPLLT
jgi:hypothetical protein